MKKLLAIVSSILALFLFPSLVFAATTSGPAGRNGVRAYPGPDKGQITLEWSRFFTDIENYIVHYGTSSGSYPFTASYIGNIVTYTIGGLQPGQKYFFAVEGVRTGNVPVGIDAEVSAVAARGSSVVAGTSGPVGRNLTLVKRGPKKGQVTLTWKKYYADADGYNVVYGLKPGKYMYGVLGAVMGVGSDPSGTMYSFTIGGLSSGTKYYFALVPSRGGNAQYSTPEVSTTAK